MHSHSSEGIEEFVPQVSKRTPKGLSESRVDALTLVTVSDILFDMKVSTRSLVREFPKAKAAARKGQEVEIYDGRTGEAFFLTAKAKKTFGEMAEMAKGVYAGPRDLSSREGFDA